MIDSCQRRTKVNLVGVLRLLNPRGGPAESEGARPAPHGPLKQLGP